MEIIPKTSSEYGETLEEERSTLKINDSEYLYFITKSEKDDGIKIKLSDTSPISSIYYQYEASKSKLKEDIQILAYYESLDEMISVIKSIFDKGKPKSGFTGEDVISPGLAADGKIAPGLVEAEFCKR